MRSRPTPPVPRAAPLRIAGLLVAGLLVAGLQGCGSSAADKADAAQSAFTAGKYADARQLCDQGLAVEGARDDKPLAWRLERIRLESIASGGDKAGEVLPTLDRLAGAYTDPTQVNAQLYVKVADELSKSGNLVAAIDLVEAGKQRFPPKKDAFDTVIEHLKKAAENDDAAMEKLKSLGYL